MTDLLIPANDIVHLGNRNLSVWLPGNENGGVHLEQTFAGHAMQSGSCFLALKLLIGYQCDSAIHANLLLPGFCWEFHLTGQVKRTLRSVGFMTEAFRPQRTY